MSDNANREAAVKEFLAAIDDPNGDYRAAVQFSEVRATAYLQRVAGRLFEKYAVMPNILFEAKRAREVDLLASINLTLLGA